MVSLVPTSFLSMLPENPRNDKEAAFVSDTSATTTSPTLTSDISETMDELSQDFQLNEQLSSVNSNDSRRRNTPPSRRFLRMRFPWSSSKGNSVAVHSAIDESNNEGLLDESSVSAAVVVDSGRIDWFARGFNRCDTQDALSDLRTERTMNPVIIYESDGNDNDIFESEKPEEKNDDTAVHEAHLRALQLQEELVFGKDHPDSSPFLDSHQTTDLIGKFRTMNDAFLGTDTLLLPRRSQYIIHSTHMQVNPAEDYQPIHQ